MFRIFVFSLLLSSFFQNGDIPKNELLGRFDPTEHEDFNKIDLAYTTKSNIYLRKEVYGAFKDMFYDAQKCGIDLKIISATRNFDYQKGIWERKWNAKKFASFEPKARVLEIMKYSSMPGTSRHHWGTDIDLNDLNNAYFESGSGEKVYAWLSQFAAEYGFVQTYTSKDDGRTGYEEEKWHWSYFPLSNKFLEQYNRNVIPEDIHGFPGSEYAKSLDVISLFVNGIHVHE